MPNYMYYINVLLVYGELWIEHRENKVIYKLYVGNVRGMPDFDEVNFGIRGLTNCCTRRPGGIYSRERVQSVQSPFFL